MAAALFAPAIYARNQACRASALGQQLLGPAVLLVCSCVKGSSYYTSAPLSTARGAKGHLVVCAGCNIQDELLDSFEQLLQLADRKGTTYDRCCSIPALPLQCHMVLQHMLAHYPDMCSTALQMPHVSQSSPEAHSVLLLSRDALLQVCAGELGRGGAPEHQGQVRRCRGHW